MKALANERRLDILKWLKAPRAHFREQIDGDLVRDGVCGILIAEKLGVSQPTLSEHMRVLVRAGLVAAKRIKQWTFYKRDQAAIASLLKSLSEDYEDDWRHDPTTAMRFYTSPSWTASIITCGLTYRRTHNMSMTYGRTYDSPSSGRSCQARQA